MTVVTQIAYRLASALLLVTELKFTLYTRGPGAIFQWQFAWLLPRFRSIIILIYTNLRSGTTASH